jgi:hypothetical protein
MKEAIAASILSLVACALVWAVGAALVAGLR